MRKSRDYSQWSRVDHGPGWQIPSKYVAYYRVVEGETVFELSEDGVPPDPQAGGYFSISAALRNLADSRQCVQSWRESKNKEQGQEQPS